MDRGGGQADRGERDTGQHEPDADLHAAIEAEEKEQQSTGQRPVRQRASAKRKQDCGRE